MSIPTNFKPITDPSIPTYSSPNLDDVFHVVDVSDTTDSAAGTSKRAKLSDVLALVSPLSIDTTKTALATLITNSEITIGAKYRITDAVQGVIWVWGVDANVISTNAALEGDYDGTTSTVGSWGDYDLATDTFTGISGGGLPTAIEFNTYEKGATEPIAVMPWYIVQGAAPTVNDDASKGFRVGSKWQDVATGIEYRLTNATTDAAVWGAQSGEWTPTLTGTAGAVSNPVITSALFYVQGNIVTCAITGEVDLDFSSTNLGFFEIDFPVLSSATIRPIGNGTTNQEKLCNVYQISENKISFISNDTSLINPTTTFTHTFQYKIEL